MNNIKKLLQCHHPRTLEINQSHLAVLVGIMLSTSLGITLISILLELWTTNLGNIFLKRIFSMMSHINLCIFYAGWSVCRSFIKAMGNLHPDRLSMMSSTNCLWQVHWTMLWWNFNEQVISWLITRLPSTLNLFILNRKKDGKNVCENSEIDILSSWIAS